LGADEENGPMINRSAMRKAASLCVLIAGVLFLTTSCRKEGDSSPGPGTLPTVKTKSGVEMVSIPGGWFDMGSEKGSPDESPVHRVWVDAFLMDKFEVTQGRYAEFPLPDPSHFKNPKHPAEQMNWTDAALYCNERSRAEGLKPCYDEQTWECDFQADGYRLPTEAEWEYACRAGSRTDYSFGGDENKLRQYAWYTKNSARKTHPMGRKTPNPWGLYDMHGNVAEWCNDFYSAAYYQRSPERNPRGPAKGTERVLRGGAWNSTAGSCRSSYRVGDPSINDTCLASDSIGFRSVRAVTKQLPVEQPNAGNRSQASPRTGFHYDEVYLKHKTGDTHPEKPRRLTAIVERLQTTGLLSQLVEIEGRAAPLEWLTTVHTPEYVERVKQACREGASYIDSTDTPVSSESYDVAVSAVGGVLSAIDAVMEGKVRNAFCAVRPPGHHALKDKAMGFCLFNNVAIAARYIQKKHKLEKILIVDWDVHHGNGTQEMFYEDPTVLYFGVHRYPFYPGTGSEAEKGRGKGLNTTVNVPLPAGSGDVEFMRAFKEKCIAAALEFRPDFVLVSAGFDAHVEDPLGGMKVTPAGFRQISRIVKEVAEECCGGRLVSVLEGGYDLQGLSESVEAHLRAMMK
jgi:acetoin utilization deacetylase AcuC-like enzyme/formylglycine-generating enzyme required for sulfatase activity